jgi:HK97 family phage major capsid protein
MGFEDFVDRTDAGALIPEEVSAEILKNLSRRSAAMARMKMVNMGRKQVRMPIIESLPYAFFRNGDTGLAQTAEMKWKNKFLNAEPIDVIVPVPKTVLDDADYDMWGQIRPACEEAIGAKMDQAIFFGADKPSVWPDAIVTAAAAVGNEFVRGSVANQKLDVDIANTMALVEDDDFDCTGHISRLRIRSGLRNLRDANGQPILVTGMRQSNGQPDGATTVEDSDTIYALPNYYARNEAFTGGNAELITGDWEQALLGMRQDIEVQISDQAVITDNAGKVVFNLFQQGMIGMKLTVRCAFQIANFITRGNQAKSESQRYPFAVLRPVGFTP